MLLEPRRGRIFAWSGSGLIARAIQRLTASRWSHVGWFLDEKTVLDADWDGVRRREAGPYLAHSDRLLILELPLSLEVTERILLRALEAEGRAGYDYRLILSLLWRALTGARCHGEVREWNGSFICSELIAEPAFDVAGFRFAPGSMDIDTTTPADIVKRLEVEGA